jgi:hypothetical protein
MKIKKFGKKLKKKYFEDPNIKKNLEDNKKQKIN